MCDGTAREIHSNPGDASTSSPQGRRQSRYPETCKYLHIKKLNNYSIYDGIINIATQGDMLFE